MKKQTVNIYDEDGRQRVIDFIRGLTIDREGAKPLHWTVTVAHFRKKRTLPQNSLFHMWVSEIATDSGHPESSVKRDLKEEFAPKIESKISPGTFRSMDTSEMSTIEMTEFMDHIYVWACGFGCFLTLPEMRGRE